MFAVHLRQVYRACDKVFIRGIRSRRLGPDAGPNPGLDRRIKAFQEDGLTIKAEDAEEVMEKSESDFYNVGAAYTKHRSEAQASKEQLRYHIVKEKYFKDSLPSLLTWSEKEQIRHLATTEPDEWTPEKIAESFPVTVPVVKKLLKYPWKPATEERIARHDASAMRNWRELKDGTLDIPEELRQHFLKFSNRTIPPLEKKSIKIDVTQEEKLGEFERIVQRCAAAEKETQPDTDNETRAIEASTNKEHKHKRDSKFVTLDQLADKIKGRLEKGSKVGINDQMMVDSMESTNHVVPSVSKEVELFDDKEGKSLAEYEKIEDPMEVMSYPERIRVPKSAYKRGATYKVNDCFYDHDGKFLYRVLGMTK